MNKLIISLFIAMLVAGAIMATSLAPVKKVISNVTNAYQVSGSTTSGDGSSWISNNGPINQWWSSLSNH